MPGRSSRFRGERGREIEEEAAIVTIAAAQFGRLTWMRASSRESLKRSVKDWSVKKVGKDRAATRPAHRYEATLMGITFSPSIVVALFSFFSPTRTRLIPTLHSALLASISPSSFFVSSVVSLRTRERNETKVNTHVYKCTGISLRD